MHIIHVASELTPLAKVGGLADVIQGLSKELLRQGHTVEIILPKYACLDTTMLHDLRVESPRLLVERPEGAVPNTLFSATVDRLNVLLIEPDQGFPFFKTNSIYGGADEIDRFVYFCQAALQVLKERTKRPDILHLHDWPTALLAALVKQMPPADQPKGVVVTIHNLHHQGKSSLDLLVRSGLSLKQPLLDAFLQGDEVNLLKGAIACADQITTVSPQYEQEMATVEGSCGLQDTIRNHRSKIHGILNGIDADFWNPAHDHYLHFHYPSEGINARRLSQVIQGKAKNKAALCAELGLATDATLPLVAVITRLVPQKSPDLIRYALHHTVKKGGLFILLGSSPIPAIQEEFEVLQAECLQGDRARIIMDHNEKLAHQIYAASDLFLIPSLFEPCGLTQLIALRYGSVPVARMTGGLVNTVFDIDTSSAPVQERNGFTFDHPDTQGVDWALRRALTCYQTDSLKWKRLIQQGMARDLSWKQAAVAYAQLYQRMISGSSPMPS